MAQEVAESTAAAASWVYVVTLLRPSFDPVCPSIVGVYSTAGKAIENARKAFEAYASFYKNGSHLPLSEVDWSVISREDLTNDFSENVGSKRVLAEAQPDGGDWYESTAVAINKVRFDNRVSCDVPLLSRSYPDRAESSDENPNQLDGVSNVHIVMSACGPEDMSGDGDITLIGVFSSVDKAKKAAKAALDETDIDSEELKEISEHVKERGCLFVFDDDVPNYAIAMETVILDKDFEKRSDESDEEENIDEGEEGEDDEKSVSRAGDELDFGDMCGSGIYMLPCLGLDEIVNECRQKKRPASSMDTNEVQGDNKKPKVVAGNGATKQCTLCNVAKNRSEYSKRQWSKSGSCKECLGNI